MMLLLHRVDIVVISYGCCCCIVLILLLYRMDAVVASCWYCCCIVWMLLLHRRTSDDDMRIAKILKMPDDLMWICLFADVEKMMRTCCYWRPCAVEDLMLMKTWLCRCIKNTLLAKRECWVLGSFGEYSPCISYIHDVLLYLSYILLIGKSCAYFTHDLPSEKSQVLPSQN